MLSPPAPLAELDDLELFQSGTESLDQWLRRRARANQVGGASRTYVVAEATRLVGCCCLSSGGLDLAEAPGAIRRNMPDPIPMAILGRLAMDVSWQGKGLGAGFTASPKNPMTLVLSLKGVAKE